MIEEKTYFIAEKFRMRLF